MMEHFIEWILQRTEAKWEIIAMKVVFSNFAVTIKPQHK